MLNSNMEKICCSFNFAPHYRKEIYLKIDRAFDCDFYFGDQTSSDIKKIDYTLFKNSISEFKFKRLLHKFYYLKGQSRLSQMHYRVYILTGQPYSISDWILLVKNKIKKKHTYLWNHGLYGKENFIKRLIFKIQLKFIAGYFVYGEYAKKMMIKRGFDKNKIHVIYNSLNYSKSKEIRNKLKHTNVFKEYFKNDSPNIIFIGRLTKVKKLNMLIEVQKKLIDEGLRFNLVFVGDGDIKGELEGLVKELKQQQNVWFYGSCYDEIKISELIYNADLCISPGNIGLTAIHSLSYGTPAITHNNFKYQMPEFESIIEGKTGSFFMENSINSLKETIHAWLTKNPYKSERIVGDCFYVIDNFYNPDYQIKLLKSVLLK